MTTHYRPFLLARAGELAGLSRLSTTLQSAVSPIFRVPERTWDYENGRYSRTHEEHIAGIPEKLAHAWEGGRAYVDLSLIEQDGLVNVD